jgi:hypothetical protein
MDSPAMSDFITNGASDLPPVKTDARTPTGASSEWASSDCNKIRSSMLDVRSEIINILQSGSGATSSTLITANGSVTARTLGSRFGEYINVKDYGALGDGTTDDTVAIGLAMTAAANRTEIVSGPETFWSNGVSATVYFPRGVYRMTSQLAWSVDALTIEGEGWGTTAIAFDIANAATIACKIGNGTGAGRRSGMRNITLYAASACLDVLRIDSCTWPFLDRVNIFGGNTKTAPYCAGYGLKVLGTYQGFFDNVRVSTCTRGVWIGETGAGVEHTTSYWGQLYSGDNKEHGVYLNSGRQVLFNQPIIQLNGAFASPTTGAGLIIGEDDTFFTNVEVIGPYYEGNSGWDVKIGKTAGVNTRVHFTTINPYHTFTGGTKANTYGCVLANNMVISGGVYGGDMSACDANHPSVSIENGAFNFSVQGVQIPTTALPVYGGGAGITFYNGWIQGFNASGEQTTISRVAFENIQYAKINSVAKLYAGGAAPSAADAEGSLYLRTDTPNGGVYIKDTAGWKQIGFQAAAQADSVAAVLATLVTDFNSLLAKLRTAKLLAP